MSDNTHYAGLEASLYDTVIDSWDYDDEDFFQWLVSNQGGRALDLGCGTGRSLLPLLENGLEVDGLDLSEEMLAICQQKIDDGNLKSQLHCGDMRSFDLGCQYDTIIIPGYSFMLMSDDDDAAACLEKCKAHLKPGGKLALTTYLPATEIESGKSRGEWYLNKRAIDPATGNRVLSSQSWELDRYEQTMILLNRYEVFDSSGKQVDQQYTEMDLRYYMPREMPLILEKHGFGEVFAFGDFSFEEAADGCESVTYVANAT